ncbi:TPA: hypothetical protein SAQ65_002580 [Bacillus cereus]|nr:hypothetical protein [Bacillus cereus]
MTLNRVNFRRTDYSYPLLEPAADKIADFLYTYKSRVREFCDLMRISSGWSKADYPNKLSRWASFALGKRKKTEPPDTKQLIESAYLFFDTCQNDNDIKKMRGLVPEKLVEKIFAQRYEGKQCHKGFGAVVKVDGQDVKYRCLSPYNNGPIDSDGNRQTVDAGAWDGTKGEFIEVKFNPEAFHTKDIRYLQELASELKSKGLDYLIYLIAMDNKELTETRLKHLGFWVPGEFVLIGREEVFELQTA